MTEIAPFPTPPTIAQMLTELGAPQNYAEQFLLHQLQQLQARRAAIDAEMTGEVPTWRQEQLSGRAYVLWVEAHTIVCAIQAFRDSGSKPVLELAERRATMH